MKETYEEGETDMGVDEGGRTETTVVCLYKSPRRDSVYVCVLGKEFEKGREEKGRLS